MSHLANDQFNEAVREAVQERLSQPAVKVALMAVVAGIKAETTRESIAVIAGEPLETPEATQAKLRLAVERILNVIERGGQPRVHHPNAPGNLHDAGNCLDCREEENPS